MMKLAVYDPASALVDDDEISAFIKSTMETDDAAYIAEALGVVARAKGMSARSAKTGFSRGQLYRSFSDKGSPALKTTLAVMKALGFGLTIKNT